MAKPLNHPVFPIFRVTGAAVVLVELSPVLVEVAVPFELELVLVDTT
jgi:hypothetical protein